MNKLREKINLENLIYLIIIICPILDMASFIFRNKYGTSISPSTVIRPIIPLCIIIYLFFKKKFKVKLIVISAIYGIYAIIHILCFYNVKTNASYGGILQEIQYLINYTFMILNLFIFLYVFKDKDVYKIKKAIIISSTIYIVSIYLAILTKTSSTTYIEGIGYKGWFESGNSISAILILSLFILLQFVKNKKYNKIAIPVIILIGIFLATLIGTRTGLFGFILVIALYIVVETLITVLSKNKINKKIIICCIIGIIAIIIFALTIGGATLKRRQQLQEEMLQMYEEYQEETHITGDLTEIKKSIDNNTIEENFMSEAQKKSVSDLYNIANKLNIKNNDMRMQQLIYNICLVKNQANPILILFGNGHQSNYYELVMEMEVVALLLNFGLIGFVIYLGPFIAILFYAVIFAFKNIRRIDAEYIELILGIGLGFVLSLLTGYVFFSLSTNVIIISMCTILVNKIDIIKKGNK